jgi:hypothetical protein
LHLGRPLCNQSFHSVTWNDFTGAVDDACLHWATMRSVTRLPLLMGLGFAAALPGCAAGPAVPMEWRVSVKLVQPGTATPADIAERAGRSSGVPAHYLAASSTAWHSLSLRCGDAPACEQALQRLQADSAYFAAAERVQRQQAHPAQAPGSSSSR